MEDDVEAFYVEMPVVKIDTVAEIIKEGDEVLLRCAAHGIPKPETKWLWKGMDIQLLPNIEVCKTFISAP